MIKGKDIPAIEAEFNRALENVNSEPREAVSAACNILESIFKVYISDEGLIAPQKQDLQGVWKVVKADLGFDPSRLEDDDLKKILSGIFSIVDGIGAFRTHASSAHGQGRNLYNLEPRHARLAIHSAHTLALLYLKHGRKSVKMASKMLTSGCIRNVVIQSFMMQSVSASGEPQAVRWRHYDLVLDRFTC